MRPIKLKFLAKFKTLFSNENLVETTQSDNLKTLADEKMKTSKQLQASLKQLEFISFFETHIDKRKEESYSLSFLQELENIKYASQKSVIELIEYQKA